MKGNGQRLKILISAYACGPKWGSEIGMGWNWVINLARHCDIAVLTEEGFREDIEEALPLVGLQNKPVFYYIDMGETGRKLFWKQGSIQFYYYYRKWQVKAYDQALNLLKENKFDVIHQLNMLGFREPGFLWKIKKIPIIWGPIGGFKLMPWRYLPSIGFKGGVFFLLKNFYNILQMHSKIRVRRAFSNFSSLIASTEETRQSIKKLYGRECIVINETGSQIRLNSSKGGRNNDRTVILWCGLITGRKALPLALKALSKIQDGSRFEFHIIGDGPSRNYCMALAKKLKISKQCFWHGLMTNLQVLSQMSNSDLLVFTSLVEGTPHVVLEALSCGLPVICHDTCGQGSVVNDQCGIKIPVISPRKSCDSFSAGINKLISDREMLNRLSEGALTRARDLSWENKAKQALTIYYEAISDFNNESHEERPGFFEKVDHFAARSLPRKSKVAQTQA